MGGSWTDCGVKGTDEDDEEDDVDEVVHDDDDDEEGDGVAIDGAAGLLTSSSVFELRFCGAKLVTVVIVDVWLLSWAFGSIVGIAKCCCCCCFCCDCVDARCVG